MCGYSGALSAASPVTQIYYDALGRQVALRDANGQAFDAAGDLTAEICADHPTGSLECFAEKKDDAHSVKALSRKKAL